VNAEITKAFLENGVIGACVIALAIVVWRLSIRYNSIQETRVTEAKAVTDQILGISKEWLTAIAELTASIDKNTENVTALRTETREKFEGVSNLVREMIKELKDYVDELRRSRSGRGG
jgi:methyl-accepting chemotaxis protein